MKILIQRVKQASVEVISDYPVGDMTPCPATVEELSPAPFSGSDNRNEVSSAKPISDCQIVGKIDQGLLVFLGVHENDTKENIDYLVRKLLSLRIFEHANQKMNLSVQDIKGSILVVSQFTLYADCKRGNRPDFIQAAKPDKANALYSSFVEKLRLSGVTIETGVFGANMQVNIINDGPVTFMIET